MYTHTFDMLVSRCLFVDVFAQYDLRLVVDLREYGMLTTRNIEKHCPFLTTCACVYIYIYIYVYIYTGME